jgi:asparagine synthetase B (glutamine-hydrolysing)
VAAACDLRNLELEPYGLLWDDGAPPPRCDEPSVAHCFYASNRMIDRVLTNAGATVVLSGLGADDYLSCKRPVFLPDLVARGRWHTTGREALRWAVAQRTSVWRLLYRHAITPVLPRVLRRPGRGDRSRGPTWLRAHTPREQSVVTRSLRDIPYDGPLGHKYGAFIARRMRGMAQMTRAATTSTTLECRFPFLYRPLVDFGTRLPYWLCAQPDATKWIERRAFAHLLPAEVRDRRDKATNGASLRLAIAQERDTIEYLLDDAILADLGFIEPEETKRYARRVQQGEATSINYFLSCLSLEFWLRVHSGRWAARTDRSVHTAQIA